MVKVQQTRLGTIQTNTHNNGSLSTKIKLVRFGDVSPEGILLTNGLSQRRLGGRNKPLAKWVIPLRSMFPIELGKQAFEHSLQRNGFGICCHIRLGLDFDHLSSAEQRFVRILVDILNANDITWETVARYTVEREFFSQELAGKHIRFPIAASAFQIVFSLNEIERLGINVSEGYLRGPVGSDHFNRTELEY